MYLKDLDINITFRTTNATYSKIHQMVWLRESGSFMSVLIFRATQMSELWSIEISVLSFEVSKRIIQKSLLVKFLEPFSFIDFRGILLSLMKIQLRRR